MDTEFDPLDDLLGPPADVGGVAARKYKPKGKGRPRPRSSVVPSEVKHVDSTTPALENALENLTEVTDLSPPCDSISVGGSYPLNNAEGLHLSGSVNRGGLVSTEPLIVSQEVVTACDDSTKGDFLEERHVSGADVCQNNTEEQHPGTAESASLLSNPFDDIDLEPPMSAANGGGKFRPILNSCPVKKTHTSGKSDSNEQNKLSVTNVSGDNDMPEIGFNEEVLCDKEFLDAPTVFPPADDYFSINEHSEYGSEIRQPGTLSSFDDTHVETAYDISAERVDDTVPAEDTGTRKPPKVPRKRKARSTQPSEAVDGENNDLQDAHHNDSAMGQDVSNNVNEGDANLTKKGVKRSRKSAPDVIRQTRSRKKVDDTSGEQNEKPKKKFSHSTRGRRKRVDPVFLATPDDELDHTNVPLKDLILRAECLERESKKVPTPSSTPAVAQRTGNPSPPLEESYYEAWNDFNSDSDQHEEHEDNNVEIREASSYFNYHSHMKKTPRVTWSKVDTELFYQGIRQFGFDFTLIQQLFPGRTRNQIKLKYKKEERQHPQRISEAIENRGNGISCFQQVIDQLKAAEEREKQELSEELDEAEANEDYVQEATVDDNSSEKLEEDDYVVAKDEAEAVDATDIQESEKMDDDYDAFGWDFSSL